jgi:hypothetical protein
LYHDVDGSYVIIFDQTAESGFVWETQETVTKRGALTITI